MSAIRKYLELGKDYFNERADRDIEKYRKGDFKVTVRKNGKPYDTEISYKLKKIDFNLAAISLCLTNMRMKLRRNNELILNEATGAAICEFKGIYGGYYQLAERLLKQGCLQSA